MQESSEGSRKERTEESTNELNKKYPRSSVGKKV